VGTREKAVIDILELS